MRICFLHPMLRNYRTGFFNEISKHGDIEFLFTSSTQKSLAGDEFQKAKIRYKFALEIPNPIIREGLTPFLPFDLFGYDALVLSIPYSFPSLIAFAFGKLTGKKIITFDETWLWPNNLKYKILFPIYKFIIKNSDANIVTGSKSLEFYSRLGAKKEKIFVCYNCCNCISQKSKNTEKIRARFGIKKDETMFLYFGRIVEYKGADLLINAFQKIGKTRRKAKLVIAGSGNFKQKVEETVKESKIKNVFFAGEISEDEKNAYFSACDCFVLPSKIMDKQNVNCEAWGFTLNEAASAGKPIISTTAVGSAYDLIKENANGYIVKENSVEELCKAMRKICNFENLARMGEQSQKIIEEKINCKNSSKVFFDAIKKAESKD